MPTRVLTKEERRVRPPSRAAGAEGLPPRVRALSRAGSHGWSARAGADPVARRAGRGHRVRPAYPGRRSSIPRLGGGLLLRPRRRFPGDRRRDLLESRPSMVGSSELQPGYIDIPARTWPVRGDRPRSRSSLDGRSAWTDTGGPFGDYRTVTLDVSCDDGRARAGDCVWSEL